MRAAVVLVGHSLRRMRTLLVVGCVILFLLQNLMVLVAGSFERSGAFSQLAGLIPDFIRPMLDPSFTAALTFRGMVLLGWAHVIVLFFLVSLAIVAGTEPVGEIDARFVDLVMSRPVTRGAVIARTTAVIIIATAAPVATMLLGTWFGIALLAPATAGRPSAETVASLALNLELLAVAWGGIALAFAALSKHRSTAAAAVGLLAFSTFLLDYVGRVWNPLKSVARISPFRYFNPFAMIAGAPAPLVDLAVLVAVFVVSAAIATIAWLRRDL